MKWLRYKNIVYVLLAVIFCAAVIFVFQLTRPSVSLVRVTDSGFVPSETTIAVGESVSFTNVSSAPVWPASNVHPSHTVYPEFDPQQPIEVDGGWTFRFTEPGIWKYHDHLNPQVTGTVVVLDENGQVVSSACIDNTDPQCWEDIILNALTQSGIDAAFQEIVELSSTNRNFAKNCHDYTHIIGEHAYELFTARKDFTLTPATALCGYGFYHGFMETLLHTSGDVAEARAFCAYADKELRGKGASGASTACYHGVGHGAVDGADPRTWGNVEEMMEPGFALCDFFAETSFQQYLCATGVFNAIEILAREPKYGLSEIVEEPFAVCNRQPEERREACYSNMVPAVLSLTGNDVGQANKYINEHMIGNLVPTVNGKTTNELVTIGLFYEYIRLYQGDDGYTTEGIELCRELPKEDHLPCIAGLAGGHIKYGTPGMSFQEALDFCLIEGMTDAERDACYSQTIPYGRLVTMESELRLACDNLEEVYREKYCL